MELRVNSGTHIMAKNIYIRGDTYWARFKVAGRTYRQSLHVRVEPAKRAEAKAVRALEKLKSRIEDEVRHGITPPKTWQDAKSSRRWMSRQSRWCPV